MTPFLAEHPPRPARRAEAADPSRSAGSGLARSMLAAALALLIPGAALGQESRCWVPYAEFEPHVRHFDVARCPDDVPTPEAGFCRMAIEGEHITVYRFRHDVADGQPCLIGADRHRLDDFIRRFGLTYRAP